MDRGAAMVGLAGPVGLAIAHPGHELRLSRWIADVRPTTFILTAGSRDGDDVTRVEASRALAQRLGGRPGEVFGRSLDRDVYAWILAGDERPFAALAAELADSFVAHGFGAVVTDSWQLYNVVHDLWHLTVRAAVAAASARTGRPILCLDYPVVPEPLAARAPGPTHLAWTLSEPDLDAKLQLAAAFPHIAADVTEVLRVGGRRFLACESLHAPRPTAELLPRPGEQPPYELYGEARVAAGLYDRVLRWRHAEPIATALGAMIDAREAAA